MAVDGSPINNIFISPLKWVPVYKFFSLPPNNNNNTAFFTYEWPNIDGAIELLIYSNKFSF